MIVTGDLNFELVAGQRKWFMQAGCSFCMAQLMIIFANNEVKMELTEPKNTSNNSYYANVAVTIIANTLPLSRFVRMATYGLSYGLTQWAAIGAPTTTTNEDMTKCTCRS